MTAAYQDIDTAIASAEVALAHLRRAHELLSSASGWGIVDILGGGLITTMIKRSKMGEARSEMQIARNAVREFDREMQQLDRILNVDLEIDGLLGFADYFLDSGITDLLVQSRISDTRRRVEEAIFQLEDARAELLRLRERGY